MRCVSAERSASASTSAMASCTQRRSMTAAYETAENRPLPLEGNRAT
jgi:hypothetical protein